ncbi:sigma-70 family RNA polymerase sigma factor family protein [Flindersiella endophytica]
MSQPALDATSTFDEYRKLLMGVAYRILGRWADAEDVVQDAWLRWREVEHEGVDSPRAYLVQVTTRLSIDRLRRAQTRHETYVGEWLPEPALTEPDVADSVALSESVSLAMLVVLEALSPLERAVFVLREAFDFSYAEIASMLDRSEPAVRQLAKRARAHVDERKTRFEADREAQRRATQGFLTAAANGEIESLLKLLAPDVELHSDGGGVQKAPRRTIFGPDKVARFFSAIIHQGPPNAEVYAADVNGSPGIVVTSNGQPFTVMVVSLADDHIARIDLLANTDKMAGVRDIATRGTRLDFELPEPDQGMS